MTWYLQQPQEPIVTPLFFHSLMERAWTDEPTVGRVNSSLYEPCKEMFLEVCSQAGIETDTVYRACLNATFYHPDKHTGIHVDHSFPHRNFLMYLNDTDAPTYMFDKDRNIVETSTPKKNRAIFFDGDLHAQGSCKPSEVRIVFVVTYK